MSVITIETIFCSSMKDRLTSTTRPATVSCAAGTQCSTSLRLIYVLCANSRSRNALFGSTLAEAQVRVFSTRLHSVLIVPYPRFFVGYNIELMNKHIPISTFDAIYLIDLCEPLLQVARKRFAAKGWNNVHVLCQDATEFSLPEWTDGMDPKGSVSFVTLSYSLSMVSLTNAPFPTLMATNHSMQIPNFYALLDRIDHVLSPLDGLLGVVDFYTAGKQPSLHERAIGGTQKECGWLSRWFWQIW